MPDDAATVPPRGGSRDVPGPGPRQLTVAEWRLPRWVAGFQDRHTGVTVSTIPDGFLLESADGSWARVQSPVPIPGWLPDRPDPVEPGQAAQELALLLAEPRVVGVLLIRRGGYGAARVRSGEVLASKAGRRRVHGRSAAGGWSQQRFARRRDNQTAEMLEAAVRTAREVLLGEPSPELMVTGGDKALIRRALDDPGLRPLRDLPRGAHLPVGDPRAAVLREVARIVLSFQVLVFDPGPTDRGEYTAAPS